MNGEQPAVKEPEKPAPKPGEGSAPSEDGGDNGGIETPENETPGAEKPEGDDHPSKRETIQALRKDRRSLRERTAALEKENQELKERVGAEKPRGSNADGEGRREADPSFFEDPERRLDEREKRFRSTLIGELMVESEKQEALKLIYSQPGFSNKDEDAFADLMEEHGLDVLARQQPLKATRLAVKLWAEEKGITVTKPEAKARAASVRGSAPGSGAKKITRSYLQDLQTRISKGEDVGKELDEAWTAAKEGRIIDG